MSNKSDKMLYNDEEHKILYKIYIFFGSKIFETRRPGRSKQRTVKIASVFLLFIEGHIL